MAWWMADSKDRSSKGLDRYSVVAVFCARSRVPASSWAVMKTMGIERPDASSRSWRSKPLSPRKWTSSIRQSGLAWLPGSRNSSAEAKVSMAKPADRRSRRSARRTSSSSSITQTLSPATLMAAFRERWPREHLRGALPQKARSSRPESRLVARPEYMGLWSYAGRTCPSPGVRPATFAGARCRSSRSSEPGPPSTWRASSP